MHLKKKVMREKYFTLKKVQQFGHPLPRRHFAQAGSGKPRGDVDRRSHAFITIRNKQYKNKAFARNQYNVRTVQQAIASILHLRNGDGASAPISRVFRPVHFWNRHNLFRSGFRNHPRRVHRAGENFFHFDIGRLLVGFSHQCFQSWKYAVRYELKRFRFATHLSSTIHEMDGASKKTFVGWLESRVYA